MPAPSLKDNIFFQKAIASNYAKLLGFELADICPDTVTLKMPITVEKHGNTWDFAHGGAIMSLADTTMGCACFNQGRMVTTLDLNINFIKSAKPTGYLKAVGSIIHNGSRTMVAEAELYSDEDTLIAKARGTFFVIGEASDLEEATS